MAQRYLALLLRWRWILVASAILAAGVAYWIAKDQPVEYTAHSSLMVGPGIDSSNPDLNALRAGSQLMQTYAELPTTTPFLQSVIDELDIDMTPGELLEMIEIRASDITQILRIEVTHGDPAIASAVAGVIAEDLLRLSPSNPENTGQLEDLIRNQILLMEQSIVLSSTRIIQIEADVENLGGQEEPRLGSTGLVESYDLAEARLKGYEARLQTVLDQETMQEEGPQILEELRDDTTQRILSLEADLDNTTEASIQKLIVDRLASERSHLSNLQQALVAIQRPYTSITLQELREMMAEREDLILEQIADERDLLSEMQQFNVERQIVYQDQLVVERERLDELNNTLSNLFESLHKATTNQVEIIEMGENAEPASAWLWLKVMISGAAGMIISMMVIVGTEFLSGTIESPGDVEFLTRGPVLGAITSSRRFLSKRRYELVVKTAPDSRRANDYRMLAAKLLLTHKSNPIHSIVLTSAEARRDATAVAANLATVLAQTGKKVFLIDANPDASRLGQYFPIEGKPGVADILSASIEDVEFFTDEDYPNLSIIPVNASPGEAFRLLTSVKMRELIADLSDQGGFVLINAPSFMASADSLYLASQVDGVVLVAFLSQTPQKNIRGAMEGLKDIDVPLIGSVLVGRQPRSSRIMAGYGKGGSADSDPDEADQGVDVDPVFTMEPDMDFETAAEMQADEDSDWDGEAEQDHEPETETDESTSNEMRSNIRGSSLLLAGRVIALGINFGVQMLTVRYLSKSDYGAFAYALSVVAMTTMITLLGLDKALVRFIPIFHEEKDFKKLFGTLMITIGVITGLGSATILLFTALRGFLSRTLIKDPLSLALLLILIVLTPVGALDYAFQGLLAVFAKPRAIFFRRHILGPFLKLAVVLIVIFARSNVYILSVGYLVGGLLGMLVYLRLFSKVLKDTGLRDQFNFQDIEMPFREILGFSIPLLSSDMVAIGRTTIVVVLLEYFRNTASVAEFRAIVPVAGLNLVVLQSFKLLYTPLAARMFARNDRKGINKLYWQTAVWIALITFPIFVVSFSLAQPLVVLLFGDRYANSGVFLAFLAFGNYFNAALGFNSYTLRVYGRIRYIVMVDIITTIAGLGLSLLLIPKYGALGAAISASSTLVLYNLLNHAGLVLQTGIDLFQRRYLRVYISIILSALGLFLFQEYIKPHFIISILLAGLVSLGLLLFNRRVMNIAGTFPELAKVPLIRQFIGVEGSAG